ncbi:quinone-dependent dihydroorotate dehydrogenase [Sulfurovum sp. bin170]|uniref:quinone-dependent dihydroorotate dehydrogenase n=1 Tax=Sulfurovum sp. bin170 TaxID=2695268 RepID=UPI0013DF2C04|nr:quinone-dependent dihydroorotate dehydrogenase [Sulfurovum sp. bin170]NEW60482.1 quinone-dependent dihydroorotate dehydrogenase [Sulfurovum sp. bin170]
MSLFSYQTIKKILFRLDPETAHSIAGLGLRSLAYAPSIMRMLKNHYFVSNPVLSQTLFGKKFQNPVGLAAGFDKNGEYITATPILGFGYTEIGTITPKPQDGNPKPRLFRLKEDRSIQNAMGFNNHGAEYMLKRLNKLYFFDYPIGINIGKNKLTQGDESLSDYEMLLHIFKDYGDYIVINISSPNTPGLRNLQNKEFIFDIFTMAKKITDKPILLKIAPDMDAEDAIELCKTAVDAGAEGIIATNTTVDYSVSKNTKDFGGISGTLVREKSFKLFQAIGKELYGKTTLIAVGGIEDAEDAYRRIKAGASLVQILTMLIYNGPKMVKEINEGLTKLIEADGYSNITEAIGADYR